MLDRAFDCDAAHVVIRAASERGDGYADNRVMHSGWSFRGLLTSVLIGYAVISSAG
ncbi:MAG TPA: hypothetical protein VG055_04560 [Planctomycetaceae bacterium]|nr:hypothetical protein [Planctomycetaceae bacterium]